ncbi:MAG: hypothetical protein GYB65_12770 [Chloroflexi bacterium]|nr:hypothetical protein [Chloroflexota bacterium]
MIHTQHLGGWAGKSKEVLFEQVLYLSSLFHSLLAVRALVQMALGVNIGFSIEDSADLVIG